MLPQGDFLNIKTWKKVFEVYCQWIFYLLAMFLQEEQAALDRDLGISKSGGKDLEQEEEEERDESS